MSIKPLLVTACCLLPLLASCAQDTYLQSYDSGNSMLVIGAQLRSMNAAGDVSNSDHTAIALSVKNLATSQVYSMELDSGHAIAKLPAGTYCVDSVSPTESAALLYCGQPFFTLTAHKIMVAGYFIFAVDNTDHSYTLSDSFVDKQGLFNSLSKTEIKSLEDFDATND